MLLLLQEACAITLAELDTFKGYSAHDERESLPRKLIVTGLRILDRQFKTTFLQTLVIQQKTIDIPPQYLHRLAVLGEENKSIAVHRG